MKEEMNKKEQRKKICKVKFFIRYQFQFFIIEFFNFPYKINAMKIKL